MTTRKVIRDPKEVTEAWLASVLGQAVATVNVKAGHGNWSQQLALDVVLADGTSRALRLKTCLGNTFGRSEVDYYTRDYLDLTDAPLVPCFDAQFDPAVGYHLLLEDLAATHHDRKEVPPTLEYGIAVAEALGRMHRHYWESSIVPTTQAIDSYLNQIRPGVAALELATGVARRASFERHEQLFRTRWTNPHGMSLLHGDLNPTNILTPRGRDFPVAFLDRQPFDWSLTYGVAVSDLAYFLVLWWPPKVRRACEQSILRCWYDAVDRSDYTWEQAVADWRLSVEQSLNVPFEWCSKVDTLTSMRWLWEFQLANVQEALAEHGAD
jgi:Phosphotransferase enzyme family